MMILIKICLAGLGCYLVWLISRLVARRPERHQALIVAVLSVVGGILVTGAGDELDAWRADPKPHVSAQLTQGEIVLGIRARGPTSLIAIDFPVLGRIVNVQDFNSAPDALTVWKRVFGYNVPNSLNNVEIAVANVTPERDLSFKILYEPMTAKLSVVGTDRYQMSYSWAHGGSRITKTTWHLIANGKEVGPPPVRAKGMVISPGPLSDEERKKLYEQGPPRRELK
jgi:hypothetical protein